MLIEIHSNEFKQKTIRFEEGLNVILGDENSTNSLGKSTALLVVDFALGGSSYPKNAGSIIQNAGHHSIGINLRFDDIDYYFVRLTGSPDYVYSSGSDYIPGDKKIPVEDYCKWLKEKYGLNEINGSWRSLVGLYSRVWGKNNYDVDKPLRGYVQDRDESSVNQLVKLFDMYGEIEAAMRELQNQKEREGALNKAFHSKLIKKITSREYEANNLIINQLKEEIDDIKNNLLKFTINVEEIYSRELVELKSKKREIIEQKYIIVNKIERLKLSLSDKFRVDSKQFERLQLFFENVNIEKIREIESFHTKISLLLKNQIEQSIYRYITQLSEIDKRLETVDLQIDRLLEGVNSPKIIIERIFDLTNKVNELEQVNKFYDEKLSTKEQVKTIKVSMESVFEKILDSLEKRINSHMEILNGNIYDLNKKSPTIKLYQNNYLFDHSGNTGTGKSYIDLLLFDLTILGLTHLPFVIHDSFLFKNIEDSTVSNLVLRYDNFKKQIFIAIDGIQKYSEVAQAILKENTRLKLDNDHLLYGRDWR